MNTRLQELTDKIYNEGIEKGKQEAEHIIMNAKLEAENILSDARKKATEIEIESKRNASEIDKNSKAELILFANQAINSLKSEITNIISEKVVSDRKSVV